MNNTTASASNWLVVVSVLPNAVIGIMGMCGSVITALAIYTCKKLHSPCFTLIAGSGIGSFAVAANSFAISVENVGTSLGIIPMERPGALCIIVPRVLGLWGITFHALMTLCVSLDRLCGILVPNHYRLWGKRYSVGILLSCSVFVTGQVIVGIGTAELIKRVVCSPLAPLHPLYKLFFVRLNLFLVGATVLAYVAMWISFRIRHKKRKTEQDKFMKQQLVVIPTIKAMALLYLATGVLSEILVNIVAALPDGTAAFIVMTIGIYLKNASSLVEVISLMTKNQTFRDSCKILMGLKPQTVVPSITSRRNVRVAGRSGIQTQPSVGHR